MGMSIIAPVWSDHTAFYVWRRINLSFAPFVLARIYFHISGKSISLSVIV